MIASLFERQETTANRSDDHSLATNDPTFSSRFREIGTGQPSTMRPVDEPRITLRHDVETLKQRLLFDKKPRFAAKSGPFEGYADARGALLRICVSSVPLRAAIPLICGDDVSPASRQGLHRPSRAWTSL
jgi:hypothetical protein